MKRLIPIIMLMVLLCACGQKEEEIEYYDDYEPPETTQTVKEEPATSFDFDSVLDYDVNEQIAKLVDPKKFDSLLVKHLQENGEIPTMGIKIIRIVDDGFITYYFDGQYEFDLRLDTDEGTVIQCVVNGDDYSFTSY